MGRSGGAGSTIHELGARLELEVFADQQKAFREPDGDVADLVRLNAVADALAATGRQPNCYLERLP